eukprot:CAMPEP_0117650794 /NCGR_PEP_ID=MMETSP0804-20121206/1730_1 /TAXON_ID=1074897 /ORGANISM="Tetraselmis astigmatica, Strain CCMP880" /LENGTH=320 /DNA_ID=CAMNT_0005456691 /DNA_START=189 /DNA_END=1152 /DNA_ORIENTATION=+
MASGVLLASSAAVAASVNCKADNPVCDSIKMLPPIVRSDLSSNLSNFESETGWRLRVLTKFAGAAHPTGNEVREAWKPDDMTVIVLVDPSSPNILNFNTGSSVQQLLARPFFTELQSRFGNQFFVRDNGEKASIMGSVGALEQCLKQGGCAVVPGLAPDHFYFTLIMSVSGGLVLGASTRLDPNGFAQRRWLAPILFSPLWASLFVSYGLGPVVSRTDDVLPLAINTAAFLGVVLAVYLLPRVAAKGSIGEALLDESERATDDGASDAPPGSLHGYAAGLGHLACCCLRGGATTASGGNSGILQYKSRIDCKLVQAGAGW